MSKKDRSEILKEWYDTGNVYDNENVIVSHMPNDFQQRRAVAAPPGNIGMGVEVEVQDTPKEVTVENENLKDIFLKMKLFSDTLTSYDEALTRGDEPIQTEFIKEKVKSLSVDLMRLADGIW